MERCTGAYENFLRPQVELMSLVPTCQPHSKPILPLGSLHWPWWSGYLLYNGSVDPDHQLRPW